MTNSIAGQLLSRTIALYSKLLAKKEEISLALYIAILGEHEVTSAARALACCVAHPAATADMTASQAILASVQTVMTYQPSAADALLEAILLHINTLTPEYEAMVKSMNATREAREVFAPMEAQSRLRVKGQCSATATHQGFDTNSMRHVSKKLAASANTPSTLSTALLLMHVGTAPRTVGKQRGALTAKQRGALMAKTLELVNEKVLPWVEKGGESNVHNAFADFISEYACYYYPPDEKDRAADPDTKIGSTRIDFSISNTLHESALSLVSSLGGISASFDPEITTQWT